jgi:hypothetical protein
MATLRRTRVARISPSCAKTALVHNPACDFNDAALPLDAHAFWHWHETLFTRGSGRDGVKHPISKKKAEH